MADQSKEGTGVGGEAAPARLLVVDDDTVQRMVIARVAAKAGYLTTEAGSFKTAEQLLRTREYDCITLDLSLGHQSGIELMRVMASVGCKAAIIVISVFDEGVLGAASQIGRSLKIDIREPMPKPLNLARLRETLLDIRRRLRPPEGSARPAATR